MTLKEVVKSFINEAEYSQSKFARLMNIAVDGLKELNLDVNGVPAVAYLTLDSNTLTCNLPKDYVTYIKIAVSYRDLLIPLLKNNNIRLNADDQACIPTRIGDGSIEEAMPYSWWNWGYYYGYSNVVTGGAQYNLGGDRGQISYYRINERAKQIQFGNDFAGTIVLEYLSNPALVDGEYEVHEYVKQALVAYISWAMVRNKEGVPASVIMQRRSEYYNQKRLSKIRYQSFTNDEKWQAVRKNYTQTPKM